ncbi:hypothetical protein [Streptomyces antimycoticus]|uniref:hypothetical protein n=1 Tax=Streptomyces antimycoticus TaxID=68175 RepID=UPI001F2168EC|nr:hypothetical protein [Streptomyces antimycoticus]
MVPFHASPPRRTRRVVHAAAPALVAGATLSALPASAVAGNADYGTPTIKPATSYLSGAVGATGDPTVTVKAGQSGAAADELTVSATATPHGSVTETGDVSSYQGLREDLVDRDKANRDRLGFAKGTADGQVPEQIDGFNVEGLEFAPGSGSTAHLGFRAPPVPPAMNP